MSSIRSKAIDGDRKGCVQSPFFTDFQCSKGFLAYRGPRPDFLWQKVTWGFTLALYKPSNLKPYTLEGKQASMLSINSPRPNRQMESSTCTRLLFPWFLPVIRLAALIGTQLSKKWVWKVLRIATSLKIGHQKLWWKRVILGNISGRVCWPPAT